MPPCGAYYLLSRSIKIQYFCFEVLMLGSELIPLLIAIEICHQMNLLFQSEDEGVCKNVEGDLHKLNQQEHSIDRH